MEVNREKYPALLKSILYFFFFYGILFIPFSYHIFSFQQTVTSFLFGKVIFGLLESGWGIILKNQAITSDTIALYVLILLLFILALITSIALLFIEKWKVYKIKCFTFFRIVLIYYLALQLLIYGFSKLFKGQFYLPEPNILYTPLGQISKDLLFWSTMGTSYSYNIFMGLLELVPALLLLSRKTRVLGLCIVFPVMLNVAMINFSFDISVKIHSLFLCTMLFFLLFPYLKTFYEFLIIRQETSLRKGEKLFNKHSFLKVSLKTFVIGLILLESLFPYLTSLNFNDDLVPRLYLHGAYEIEMIVSNDSIIAPEEIGVKRFFVHRKGYLIFQNEEDEMQDFRLEIDSIEQYFVLTDYQEKTRRLKYIHDEKEQKLSLQFFYDGEEYWLKSKTLDWQKLPALQNDFHWNIESVR